MKQTYWAVVYKDTDSDFGISFPDFPGCVSAGSTMIELVEMGTEALNFHIEGMHEDGETIPAPTSFENLPADPEPDCSEVSRIPVTVTVPGKKRRMNLTIDANLIDQIETKYGKGGISGFLENAARRAL
jgi:predicted RNase H-like HicB family nuclease